MKTSFRIQKILVFLFMAAILVVIPQKSGCQSGSEFNSCGILFQSSDCLLFIPFGFDDIPCVLDNYGEYLAGDTVFVSGNLVIGCSTICDSAMGCIEDNSITDCFAPNQIIIKIEDGLNLDSLLEEFGADIIDSIPEKDVYLALRTTYSYDLQEIIDSLHAKPGIIFVQPNFLIGLPEACQIAQAFPDDDAPSHLVGFSPPDYYGDTGAYVIESDQANLLARGENIIVAVIDNGIDYNHDLYGGSFAGSGYDLIDNDTLAAEEPGSLYGHGTFICGIIKRVAPDCRFLPIRAFDCNGYTDVFMIAEAVYLAINDPCDVNIINMSFGLYTDNSVLQQAINDALMAGITLVAAPGNDNSSRFHYPGAYPGVIAVSAIDSLDNVTAFSNYGPYIDVCAPGENIYSALPDTLMWGIWSGTSFSAPMVTGVCALILSLNPLLSPLEMEQNIRFTADRELQWGMVEAPDDEYGYGCVNALNPVIYWKKGDVDNSGSIDIIDVTCLINYIYKNGPAPNPFVELGDVDCSGAMDLMDITLLIAYIYMSSEPLNCL